MKNKSTILIVDDTPENLQILTDHLKMNYRVLAANSGEKALVTANKTIPDLILLDIMMPGMDGYEVCSKLKSNPETSSIPIIFVTALSKEQDEFKGLGLGAVDYISKPFNPDVLKSRVNTQVELQLAKKELILHNEELEDLVRLRSQELAEAHDRLKVLDAAKQDFLAAISHELRTPANGVIGLAELAYSTLQEYEPDRELYEAFQDASSRLLRTMDDALLLTELQTNDSYLTSGPLEIYSLINPLKTEVVRAASERKISIDTSGITKTMVMANHQLLQNALTIMILAAIKLSHESGSIQLSSQIEEDKYFLKICFDGDHLSVETIDSFFEIFSEERSSSYVEELGLGIPLAFRVVETLGGSMTIQNGKPCVVEIIVQLLIQQDA